ncbi:MAG: hypothetical protein CM15mP79_0490 [Methanobacteriota archaeon]|nr:MAG: hypothetical protein CM15mP79_0490 [Euryarchaeota archaeon]
MTEAVRPEVEWSGIESDLMNVCEEISWWAHSHWDDASQSEVHVLEATVHHRSDDSHYGSGLPAPESGWRHLDRRIVGCRGELDPLWR